LLMQPVGVPLSEFKSIYELFSVLIDILDVHLTLVMQFWILHRDVSINNTMIYVPDISKSEAKETHSGEEFSKASGGEPSSAGDYVEDSGKDDKSLEQQLVRWERERYQQIQAGTLRHGLLVDFDYATDLDQNLPVVSGDRTGTLPFMSSNILLDYKKDKMTHSTSDNLESLIYVLIWMCILHVSPGTICQDKHITDTLLKHWVMVNNENDAVSLGALKIGLRSWPTTVTDEFTMYFKPTCATVGKLLMELGQWSTTNCTDHLPHYKAIRNILLEGFGTVEEVLNWSAAKDVYGYGLLHQKTKHKVPSFATDGYEDEVESSRACWSRWSH
ncbi:hypothetical protein SCLCIDRAFT_126148, partial [Scleroderma citrinum Foug A]